MGGGGEAVDEKRAGMNAEKITNGCGCVSNVGKYNTEIHAPKTCGNHDFLHLTHYNLELSFCTKYA